MWLLLYSIIHSDYALPEHNEFFTQKNRFTNYIDNLAIAGTLFLEITSQYVHYMQIAQRQIGPLHVMPNTYM